LLEALPTLTYYRSGIVATSYVTGGRTSHY